MSTEQLIAEARARLTARRIGTSLMRETDKDLIVIRRLADALEAGMRSNSAHDIEYRDSPESDNWVLAIAGGSKRDIETAHRENERRGWQKYRVTGSEPESDALDLVALEELAKAATPGPWEYIFGGPTQYEDGEWYEPTESGVRSDVWESDFPHADAEFIAAANPQTVLALISALRASGGEGR